MSATGDAWRRLKRSWTDLQMLRALQKARRLAERNGNYIAANLIVRAILTPSPKGDHHDR